jgi:hypothetical protein
LSSRTKATTAPIGSASSAGDQFNFYLNDKRRANITISSSIGGQQRRAHSTAPRPELKHRTTKKITTIFGRKVTKKEKGKLQAVIEDPNGN